ncbi:hypothetical protein HGM15179_010559 [Zosterops borbonicus]|uniref:Uncharacterized protein n=1 Tax=Zosterops borbonicus TaxID=364589 RepID=A0A8K1GD52_9PASS|nr:hypothetical protein HGM15179_010559 [Zosterops borbonicus]
MRSSKVITSEKPNTIMNAALLLSLSPPPQAHRVANCLDAKPLLQRLSQQLCSALLLLGHHPQGHYPIPNKNVLHEAMAIPMGLILARFRASAEKLFLNKT